MLKEIVYSVSKSSRIHKVSHENDEEPYRPRSAARMAKMNYDLEVLKKLNREYLKFENELM